jgi:hypothetical protein
MISLTWLSSVGRNIASFVPAFGTLMGFVAYIYELGETVLVGGLNFLSDRVSAIDTSAFANASFAAVVGIGYGNAVFPLTEMVSIWTALGTACLTVVIIRWVKSFIPTVSN